MPPHVLTGSGTITLAVPEALGIALSGVPANVPGSTSTPRSVMHVGRVALGDSARGWRPEFWLSRDLELLDQLGGRYDRMGYDLAAGVTATVTEYPTTTLDALFNAGTGHAHDGTGEGAPIPTLGLAAGAVSQSAIGTVGALTTTSTTLVDMTGTLTLTGCLAGNRIVALLMCVVKNNTGGGRPQLGININGVDTQGVRVEASTLLTTHVAMATAVNLVGTVTVKPRLRNGDGQSITADGGQLLVLEIRR